MSLKSTDLCITARESLLVTKQVRFEDMSPTGRLEILQQVDGDIIISVLQDKDDFASAHVEFCTPMTGGGQSERTWKALVDLMEAMRLDNAERAQVRGE